VDGNSWNANTFYETRKIIRIIKPNTGEEKERQGRKYFHTEASGGQQLTFQKGTKAGEGTSEGERAKREGRGADTGSCGAIALQRKCDTFPIVSLWTAELPLDRDVGEGRGGERLVTDGQLPTNVRIHGPSSPPHTQDIPASSLSP